MDNLTKELEQELKMAREAENLTDGYKKTIVVGCDHAGFELKEHIKNFLRSKGYQVEDEGAFKYDETDDYPKVCRIVAKRIAGGGGAYCGLLFGGSGQGEAMTANRVLGARATVFYGGNQDILKLSREHNDANILSLGARFLTEAEAEAAVLLWLETSFSNEERHSRRVKKIDGLITEENIF
ncbi:MAG: RpiB/LacA/LacB family sugar-phosphate isomerase [Candidatus Paceibacterota bacterium]